jgi:hypothetical protein
MFEGVKPIFSYTRAQAIADGMLVDLRQGEWAALVKEAGFKYPLAMTNTAFAAVIGENLPDGQDQKGRLWDVLLLLRQAIRKTPESDRAEFTVAVWDGIKHVTVELWALCGPGDDAEPVITIMLEGED